MLRVSGVSDIGLVDINSLDGATGPEIGKNLALNWDNAGLSLPYLPYGPTALPVWIEASELQEQTKARRRMMWLH